MFFAWQYNISDCKNLTYLHKSNDFFYTNNEYKIDRKGNQTNDNKKTIVHIYLLQSKKDQTMIKRYKQSKENGQYRNE